MKLQDFLGKNIRYDVNAIAADAELSRQIQVRLIDLGFLEPPADGRFGPISTAALNRFQSLMQCQEPGYLGAKTSEKLIEAKRADIPAPSPVLEIVTATLLKAKPLANSQLSDAEKHSLEKAKKFELVSYEVVRNHVRVTFRKDSFKNSKIWYLFGEHIKITQQSTSKVEQLYPKPKPKTVKLNVPYKSQLDNWYNPTGSCNVTSLAMCLEFLGAARKSKQGQFEDELYQYAERNGLSRHDPYDLARIVKAYGCKDDFTDNATIEEVQDWLADGKPAVIHGYFTSFGHIIVLVGYTDDGFIVHDPYGEWFPDGYRTDLNGAYLDYSYRMIRRTCIPDGSFWVHFISK